MTAEEELKIEKEIHNFHEVRLLMKANMYEKFLDMWNYLNKDSNAGPKKEDWIKKISHMKSNWSQFCGKDLGAKYTIPSSFRDKMSGITKGVQKMLINAGGLAKVAIKGEDEVIAQLVKHIQLEWVWGIVFAQTCALLGKTFDSEQMFKEFDDSTNVDNLRQSYGDQQMAMCI